MSWEDAASFLVALAALLSAAAALSGRGSRARTRISRDLENADRLPDGRAKRELVKHAEDAVIRLVYAERRGTLGDVGWALFFALDGAVGAAAIALPLVGDDAEASGALWLAALGGAVVGVLFVLVVRAMQIRSFPRDTGSATR